MSRNVVLVHGLWYGPVAMGLLARRLGRGGLECHRFGYPTLRRSLPANARSLHEFARDLDGETLDFVGHSLGGLVILRMLDEFGAGLPPGRLVLLGTPVNGSGVARRVAGMRGLRVLVGQAKTALDQGFRYAPAGRETGVIAGTGGVGIGVVFNRLERPHDGTVSVAETHLEGAGRLTLPVTHTGLVTSRRVAEATGRFLQTGHFGKP